MKSVLALSGIGLSLLSLSGCAAVATPVPGLWFTDVKYGDMVTS